MISNKEIEEDWRRAIESAKCNVNPPKEAMEKEFIKQLLGIKGSPPEPEVVYIAGRTFWDWLAERELPGRKTLWKTLGCILLAIAAIGDLFLTVWLLHFGPEWANEAIGLTGIFAFFGCAVGFFAILTEGFKP